MGEFELLGRNGFFGSFQDVTHVGGQLLALLVVGILQPVLDDAELRARGLRIPFPLGAVPPVVSLSLIPT